MNKKIKPNMGIVRKAAERHEIAEAVLAYIWPPKSETTTVDEVVMATSSADLETDRGSLVHFLKDLGQLGYGRFVTGRRGLKSRFEWSLSVLQYTENPHMIQRDEPDESPSDFIDHSFMLRRDVKLVLSLPTDMTQAEARRLSTFITSLPFGEEREG